MGENGSPEEVIKPPQTEIAKPPNPLVIFGQGPVIDKELKLKVLQGAIHTPLGGEGINFWAENLAKAASIMYEQNNDQQIIVMGGRTGGEDYDSESNLIANELIKLGVPESAIKKEELSKETIENLINLDKMKIKGTRFDIMGAPYHIARIQVLMQLLDIPFDNVFSSDEVLRWNANGDKTKLDAVERRLEMDNKDYYAAKLGLEHISYRDKMLLEDVLTRELLERPESWLKWVAKIDDPNKRKEILRKADKLYSNKEQDGRIVEIPSMLKTRFKIDLEHDSDEAIKEKVSGIKAFLSQTEIDEWKRQAQSGEWPKEALSRPTGWPKETLFRLNKLIEVRQPRKPELT